MDSASGRSGGDERLLVGYGLVSFAAVGLGALICALSGVPARGWILSLAAWAVGALAAFGLARGAGHRTLGALILASTAALMAVFASPGQEGVHRWVALGPVSINAAMLVLPSAVVALAALAKGAAWPWAAALAILGLLVWQPDASQATAWALAMAFIALRQGPGPMLKTVVVAAAVAGTALAWMRPDPLAPVPEVEGVLGLAWALAPALAVIAAGMLALVAAAPLAAHRGSNEPARTVGVALTLTFAAWAVMPALGAFPVPWLGVGMSPILGAWLGVGALAGLLRRAV